MQGLIHPLLQAKLEKEENTVAIEKSRQFKDLDLDDKLKAAKIENLRIDSAKNRQELMDSIQKQYGSTGRGE